MVAPRQVIMKTEGLVLNRKRQYLAGNERASLCALNSCFGLCKKAAVRSMRNPVSPFYQELRACFHSFLPLLVCSKQDLQPAILYIQLIQVSKECVCFKLCGEMEAKENLFQGRKHLCGS